MKAPCDSEPDRWSSARPDLPAKLLCRTSCPLARLIDCAKTGVRLVDRGHHPVGIYAGVHLRDDNQTCDEPSRKITRASMEARRNEIGVLRQELARLREVNYHAAS